MARNRSIHVSALNITLFQHSSERYIELFREARRNRLTYRYHGDRHAMIGFLVPEVEDAPERGLRGLVSTFLEIDTGEEWLNTQTGRPAEEDDLEEVRFPDYLKPNMRSFHFVFFPEEHRLFFETRNAKGRTISPGAIRVALEGLLNHPLLQEEFGPCDITVEPEHEALEAIFAMPRLNRLVVHITRPNADDQDDAENEILERLGRQNARSHTEDLRSADANGLTPDDQYRTLARVAASNGYVEAHGRDADNSPDFESTKEHPMKEVASFDPDSETEVTALWAKAQGMLTKILRRG